MEECEKEKNYIEEKLKKEIELLTVKNNINTNDEKQKMNIKSDDMLQNELEK
jgi:hypothetical protein